MTDFRQFLQGVPQARRAEMNVVYLQFTPQDVYAEQSVFLRHDFRFNPENLAGNIAGEGNISLEAHPEYNPHNPANNATPASLLADIQAMEDHFNQNHPENIQTLFTLPVKLHFEGHENETIDVLPIYESTSDTIFMVNDLQGTHKTMANVATYIQRAVAYVMAQNNGSRSLKPESIMAALLSLAPVAVRAAQNERQSVLDKMSLLLGFLPINAQEEVLGHLGQVGIQAEEDGRVFINAPQRPQLAAPAAAEDNDNDDEDANDENDDEDNGIEDVEFVMRDP